ncbi:MAG: nucleotidyltransferase family protein [Clostridia bacterium]
MKICATVAEFNPFHNGHGYLAGAFREEYDGMIAVMSGNFVQRGEAAVYNKFARAKAAIANGFDLVIELPIIYALSSAEFFATGAIKILNSTNVVDSLVFGSELGEIEPLREVAMLALDETSEFKDTLKFHLSSGEPYPKALAKAYATVGIDEKLVTSPNNILGIEYIKALIKTKSTITPMTLRRFGASHDSFIASNSVASASHIRSLIEKGSFTQNFMPTFPYPVPVFDKQFSNIILYALKSAKFEDLIKIPDCSSELASRFLSASKLTNVNDIVSYVKTKNYTESRIRRILWNLVLKNNISPSTDPTYIRILAQNKQGSKILSQMKAVSTLPIVQKSVELKKDNIFILESTATDIYNIATGHPSGEDFRHTPVQM